MAKRKKSTDVTYEFLWHIDKQIHGRRVCQSCGTDSLEEAEHFLARLMEEARQAIVYGVRPQRTFEQAAAKFVLENQHKRSIDDDISRLKNLISYIGEKPLENVHIGTLQQWIEHRQREGVTTGTINHGLKVVRRIVNLAASEWLDEYGLTWLKVAPKIRLLPLPPIARDAGNCLTWVSIFMNSGHTANSGRNIAYRSRVKNI